MPKITCGWLFFIASGLFGQAGHAAIVGAYTQAPAGAAATFNLGSTQTLTYNVRNANTGADTGRCFSRVRFRVNNGTTFSASTVAPAGWTRNAITTGTTTSVSFTASSAASYIPLGGSVNFPLVLVMRTATADTNVTLRDVRPSYTNITCTAGTTNSGAAVTGAWSLKSLAITSFQITDLSGTAITAVTAGTSFQLRMTVKNNTTVTQTTVVSNPNPPSAVKTGVVTQALTSTAGSPLSLTAGASGTIIFTFSTVAIDNGTIFFTADARNGATVTSNTATSSTLAISKLTASLAVSSSCRYSGNSLTVTMTINNATASAATAVGAMLTSMPVQATYVSGPTPASIVSIASMGSATVTWIYTINNAGSATFSFGGNATGTVGGSSVTTPTATSPTVTRGEFATGTALNPATVNAGSSNVEMTATVTNNGCAAVNSVEIMPAASWTGTSDAYSLVNLSAASAIETWTASGGGPVIFTAPNMASQMPLTFSGSFAVVFAATPAGATVSAFNIRVTDANGVSIDVPLNVNVNAFKSGGLNDALNKAWREDFR